MVAPGLVALLAAMLLGAPLFAVIGGLAMPLLLASGYRERAALGLVTGGGLPGVLLFPALPLLLYAIVAKTSIESMFVGGFLPTLLMLGIAVWWGVRQRPQRAGATRPFDRNRAAQALWSAKWDLSLPLVPLAILLGGLATPVEAAAATALYSFLIAAVIHRDIRPLADAPRIMTECGLLVGGILMILGVSLGFTNYLVDAQIPERAVEWVTRHIHSPWAFLLALNGLLLLVGCVMDIFSAIVAITPLVVIPLFLALSVGVLAITYLPWLSTGLLNVVR